MPEEPKKLPDLKCPHCGEDMPKVEFRAFGDGQIWLIGCPQCLKVVAGNYEFNIPNKQ